MKLRGDSCTVVDGSGASDWPKSTFAVLVLPRGGRCRGVRDIVTVHEQTESSCASVYRANDFKSIHALRQNINTVAMLTSDALMRHFSKRMYHAGNRRLHTLISYVLLVKPPRVQVEYLCQLLREKHHHRKLVPVTTTVRTRCKGQGAGGVHNAAIIVTCVRVHNSNFLGQGIEEIACMQTLMGWPLCK